MSPLHDFPNLFGLFVRESKTPLQSGDNVTRKGIRVLAIILYTRVNELCRDHRANQTAGGENDQQDNELPPPRQRAAVLRRP